MSCWFDQLISIFGVKTFLAKQFTFCCYCFCFCCNSGFRLVYIVNERRNWKWSQLVAFSAVIGIVWQFGYKCWNWVRNDCKKTLSNQKYLISSFYKKKIIFTLSGCHVFWDLTQVFILFLGNSLNFNPCLFSVIPTSLLLHKKIVVSDKFVQNIRNSKNNLSLLLTNSI